MTPYFEDATLTAYLGDVRDVLRELPDESVHCVVTSPPYYGLRDYGVDGQIGLEPTPAAFVAELVAVFREVRRVLRKDGTLWLNLGDSYASGAGKVGDRPGGGPKGDAWNGHRGSRGGSPKQPHTGAAVGPLIQPNRMPLPGLKPKDRIGIPHRVVFALQDDGWWWRDEIVWHKPNPMPSSVTDRTTPAHEFMFMLSRSRRYAYDQEAIREPFAESSVARLTQPSIGRQRGGAKADAYEAGGLNDRTGSRRPNEIVSGLAARWDPSDAHARLNNQDEKLVAGEKWGARHEGWQAVRDSLGGRNKRSVWTIATQPFPEAHFACVDPETEALTPDGWRRHDQLQDGDLIAQYQPNGLISWAPASIHRYDYSGPMVVIEKRDASQRLTPNHRVLVRQRSGTEHTVRADELVPGMSIPMTAGWDTCDRPSIGFARAALLGWYIAEGWRQGNAISISQSETANPTHVQAIDRLLSELGATATRRRRERTWRGRPAIDVEWRITGKVASDILALAPSKRAEPWMAELRSDEAAALLVALVNGDGHKRRDGRMCIVQKDRESIDAMQMIALRLGYRAHVSTRKDGIHVLYLTTGRWLTLRGTNGVHDPLPRENNHAGLVWCPSVPSGYWLARRNGKPFITGNTFPERLVEPCILAGCPEGGVVLDPFGGAGTVALVANRLGRKAIHVDLNPAYMDIALRRVRAAWEVPA